MQLSELEFPSEWLDFSLAHPVLVFGVATILLGLICGIGFYRAGQIKQTPFKASQVSPPNESIPAWFPWFFMLCGSATVIYFFSWFDTSVASPMGLVNNLGLMNQRTNGIIIGIGSSILGAIFLLLRRR